MIIPVIVSHIYKGALVIHGVKQPNRRAPHLLAPKGEGAPDEPVQHGYLVPGFDALGDPDIQKQTVFLTPGGPVPRKGKPFRSRGDAAVAQLGDVSVLDAIDLGQSGVGEAEAEIPGGRVGEADVLVDGDPASGLGGFDFGRDVFGISEIDEAGRVRRGGGIMSFRQDGLAPQEGEEGYRRLEKDHVFQTGEIIRLLQE